jgi:hypothetical protein
MPLPEPHVRIPTWNYAVLYALESYAAPTRLDLLYVLVAGVAPDLVRENAHWHDKVRQVVQRLERSGLARHVSRGVWTATNPNTKHRKGRSA